MANNRTIHNAFAHFAASVAKWAGQPQIFALALAVVVIWAASGPLFDFGEVWQLVINTGTTIVTFLMVFLLQNAQTRDTAAIQAKLDELILTTGKAEKSFIGIEKLDDDELDRLEKRVRLAARKRKGQGKS